MPFDRLARLPWVDRLLHPPPVVAVVRLSGIIGPTGMMVRHGLSLHTLAAALDRAFSLRRVKAVALAINSPGGSPVQSALIHTRIRALAKEKNIPVHAFAEDVAASGGYWLALAADEIHADANSIIGSIGVVSAGFGFPALLERMGVERRVHATGPRKAMLDPFRPENPDDVVRLREIQAEMYESFKALVHERRGDRLQATDETLFSGDIWTGRSAQSIGLIDGIGDMRSVMRAKFGDAVRFRLVNPPPGWLRRKLGSAGDADGLAGLPAAALSALEERAWWSRYGL